jgi:hypothetical protein
MPRVTTLRGLLLGVLLIVLVLATPTPADDPQPPAVAPVNSKPYGLSYGQWSARQWQWEFSFPVDQHPLFDTADASAGQSGPVWATAPGVPAHFRRLSSAFPNGSGRSRYGKALCDLVIDE